MSFEFDFDMSPVDRLIDNKFEKIAPEMLNAAAPILVDSTKSALQSVIKHPGDSELVNSIKARKPKITKTDACILNVVPTGVSKNMHHWWRTGVTKYPVTNVLKAIWLQYGVSGRMPAKPWLFKAKNQRGYEILARMQQKYDELIGAE